MLDNSVWIVGNGESINFSTDNWLGAPLVHTLQIPPQFCLRLNCTVQMGIHHCLIELPAFVLDNVTIVSHVSEIIVPCSPLPDKFVWLRSPDGLLYAKDAFNFFCTRFD